MKISKLKYSKQAEEQKTRPDFDLKQNCENPENWWPSGVRTCAPYCAPDIVHQFRLKNYFFLMIRFEQFRLRLNALMNCIEEARRRMRENEMPSLKSGLIINSLGKFYEIFFLNKTFGMCARALKIKLKYKNWMLVERANLFNLCAFQWHNMSHV